MKLTKQKTSTTILLASALSITLFGVSSTVSANAVDEAADACKEAARLLTEDDDLDGAIEEANWCITGLKQLKNDITLSLLPDEVYDYVGGDIENENIMGMNNISRQYTLDGDTISVTILTPSADGGGLGGLGELGKLMGALSGAGGAAMAGNGKKIRVQKRTVIVSDEGNGAALHVELKSGGSMQVESQALDSDDLVEFLREFPLAELDDALTN